jgi:hypothetical protein
VLAVAWGVRSAYFALTDGFSIANISSDHPDNPHFELPPLTADEKIAIDGILSQEFTYLGKGHHSYVFESQDKQYVIKFLKFRKYRHHPIYSWLPLPSSLHVLLNTKTDHKQAKRDLLLQSWKIAFTKLQTETQLLWIHLNRAKPLGRSLKVYNKCGIPYSINLDQHVFMIQKKVEVFGPYIKRAMSSGNIAQAKNLLEELIAMYQAEFQCGLLEDDRYIMRNMGFVDGKPIHLDVDKFREDLEIQMHPHLQHAHLLWKTTLLLEWLERRYPELASHLQQILPKASI